MLRNLFRRLDRFRRRHTVRLSAWFYRTLGADRFLLSEQLEPHEIKRILVLRNNKRIGNMYFLLPFMHALRDAFPDATIELMVIQPSQAQVFANMPIDQVHVSHFSFATALSFLKLVRQQRKVVYDLVLMPHGSATDTIIAGLLHARNKVADSSDRYQPVFKHSSKLSLHHGHAAKTPLPMIEAVSKRTLSAFNHHMALTDTEISLGKAEVARLQGSAPTCIAYFRGARGNKVIADQTWQMIRQGFNEASPHAICWIEILSPDIEQPLQAGTLTWQSANLRELAAFLRACDLFICGDTGPLHLADAAGARCLGLFTATSPVHYGCLGADCVNATDPNTIDFVTMTKMFSSARMTIATNP